MWAVRLAIAERGRKDTGEKTRAPSVLKMAAPFKPKRTAD